VTPETPPFLPESQPTFPEIVEPADLPASAEALQTPQPPQPDVPDQVPAKPKSRRKRQPPPINIHPAVFAGRHLKKRRSCIVCGREFNSRSPENRKCGKCRRALADAIVPMVFKSMLKDDEDV
jgi:hypothetical protein